MESRTSDINKRHFASVSPYQIHLNVNGKNKQIEYFQREVYFIWAIPVMATIGEIMFLKKNNLSYANKLSLFKWTSYILALIASNFGNADLLRKLDYYDRIYPKMPQIQIEQIRDAEILKNYNI